ncbi:hypothetical protein [Brevundimonas sp.]|uniref:hypothetical protein n=1 Tax=Brevundimonas sp. TaxID=1871086 RepID=UPI001AD4F943|nr:hypothetical protein [Brevundimonas sp.]MBN9466733.1 hypothetical protein [Brevundimonas sp.]
MIATALKRDWWLLVLNAVAMVVYIWAGSPEVFEPSTRSFDVEYGLLSYLRIQSVLPFLVLVGVIDAAWIILRLRRLPHGETQALAFSALALCGGWIATHVINRMFG